MKSYLHSAVLLGSLGLAGCSEKNNLDKSVTGLEQEIQELDESTMVLDQEIQNTENLIRSILTNEQRLLGNESFVGIGVTLVEQDGKTVITAVFPGSPAHTAGIVTGDVILELEIDNRSMTDASLEEIRGILTDPSRLDQDVHITVSRGEETHGFSVPVKTLRIVPRAEIIETEK